MCTDIYGGYPSYIFHAEWKVGVLAIDDDICAVLSGISLVLVRFLEPNVLWLSEGCLEMKGAKLFCHIVQYTANREIRLQGMQLVYLI